MAGSVFAQTEAAPTREAEAAKKRAAMLYLKLMQGMGSELYAVRNELVEQLSPDNRTVTPDDIRALTIGRELNFLQVAVLNRKGETVVANNMLDPLHLRDLDDVDELLKSMAEVGGTFIHDEAPGETNGLRIHVLLPLTISREVVGQEAFFVYLYVAPKTYFSAVLAKENLSANERLHIIRADGEGLFASSPTSPSSLAASVVRKQFRNLNSLFRRVTTEEHGTAQYAGFAFDTPNLADHQVSWQHKKFMKTRWVVLYDQSTPHHLDQSDLTSISGIWEGHEKNAKTGLFDGPSTRFAILQEGAFWQMQANGGNLNFSANGRYLNRKLASTQITQLKPDKHSAIFNISGFSNPDKKEIQLSVYRNQELGATLRQYVLKPLLEEGLQTTQQTPQLVFTAADISATTKGLLRQSGNELAKLADFASEHGTQNDEFMLRFRTLLEKYPGGTDGLFVNAADFKVQQLRGNRFATNNQTNRWPAVINQMEETGEATLETLGRWNGRSHFIQQVPVYSKDGKQLAGIVSLIFPTPLFFQMVQSVLPDEHQAALIIMDDSGSVLHRSIQLPFEQELAERARQSNSENMDIAAYDPQTGDPQTWAADWNVCEISTLRFVIFNIAPQTTTQNENALITGRWRGQFNIRTYTEETYDPMINAIEGGQIVLDIVQNRTDLKILAALDGRIEKFSGTLSDLTIAGWASEFISDDTKLEYFVARLIEHPEQIHGAHYTHSGDKITERNFIVQRMRE